MNWKDFLFDFDLFSGVSRRGHVYGPRRRWRGPRYFNYRHLRKDQLLVTGLIATIVRCNAPLTEGLEVAASDAPSFRLAQILFSLRDDLGSGQSLSESMSNYPRFFPAWYIDVVRAGESSGTLVTALRETVDYLRETEAARATLRGWIAYLAFVLIFQASVGAFLLTYILPEYLETLKDFGVQPGWVTRLQEVWNHRWLREPAFVSLAIVFSIATIKMLMFPRQSGIGRSLRSAIRTGLLYVPVLREPAAKANLTAISSVLGRLLAARIPLDEALEDCAALTVDRPYRSALARTADRVRTGMSLTHAVAADRRFIASFRAMVALGESAGRLPETLTRTAALYRRDVVKTIKMILDVVGPLGVFALGGITLLVLLAAFGSLAHMYMALLESL
ncbi:MAG: hypothetical protein AMXMBFR4_31750 [Candidatus Hydrogenedentota bacterium]